ncbi:hypothetical protein F8S13_03545 [Chloroflexia bacterium SDU3-3]|nr:hypothetical protein F8S13_03545 [Chloroflexia bacterium SDU3-3]
MRSVLVCVSRLRWPAACGGRPAPGGHGPVRLPCPSGSKSWRIHTWQALQRRNVLGPRHAFRRYDMRQ